MTEKAEKGRRFVWNSSKERAAQLLAEDELTDAEISERTEISARQLYRLKNEEEFRARVEKLARELGSAVFRNAVARRNRRVKALNDRWLRMQRVIDERGASREMENVPGGQTGLLVHTVKGIGKGEDFEIVDLYAVDTGLLKEMRDHEKQAAQELGQWVEKQEHSGEMVVRRYVGVNPEDV